jgi:hypothetical protein
MTKKLTQDELRPILDSFLEATETKDTFRIKYLGKYLHNLGYTRTEIEKEINKISLKND